MTLRKSMAIVAACAALAFTGASRADSSAFTLQAQPKSMQTDETRRPLMALLNEVGLASPLEEAKIEIGGYINGSTTFYADRGGTFDANTGTTTKNSQQVGRLFDSENQDPTLNGIQVYVERVAEVTADEFDIGFRMEWLWGGDARFIHSTGLFDYDQSGDEQYDLTQLYMDFALPVGNGLNLRAGKFVALSGYEVIDATKRPLYSTGYLFSSGPGTHTGVIGTYAFNENWVVDGGIIRGWDDALEDKNGSPSGIGRIGYKGTSGNYATYLTVIVGPEQADNEGNYRTYFNSVTTFKLSDQITTAIDAVYVIDSGRSISGDETQTYGVGGWMSWVLSDYFTANGRLEWFNDSYNQYGFDTVLYSATAGVTITPFPTDSIGSNLKLRPELRYDYADNQVFGDGQNSLLSLGLEAYFTF